MNNDGSSLKKCKFDGLSKDQIINKYETVLAMREIQLSDLSMELGRINDKLCEVSNNTNNIIYQFIIYIILLGLRRKYFLQARI